MAIIYHIAHQHDWQQAEKVGAYTADSLETEGFIHCSTKTQVVEVANNFYKGQQDLVLLCLDETQLTAEVLYEDSHQNGILFPHIYGSINLEAVINVIPFPCDEKGVFQLPPAIT